MLSSDLYELDGFSGICPGSRDLVPRPHDRDSLSQWMVVEHYYLRRAGNENH